MLLLHNKSVLRYLLYYLHLYHVLTLSLPSRAVSIIFHYPASLCYAGSINVLVLLELKLCLVINCLITSLLISIFDWKTFETSDIIINHSYLWRKRLIHVCNQFMSNTLITRVITHILSVYIYYSLLCYIYVQLIFIISHMILNEISHPQDILY